MRSASGDTVRRGLSDNDVNLVAAPVSVSRAYEQLAGEIRTRILAGELAEGERLPSEATIGAQARVSRSTVREALRVLEEAGFVERSSPRILVVRRPQAEEPALHAATRALQLSNVCFDDLIEALLALDPALTRLATERAGDDQVVALEEHLTRQERLLGEPHEWSRFDDEFHTMIAEMSGNAPLTLARRPVSALLLPTMWRFVRSEAMTRAAFTFHRRIVEQIRTRDPEAAAFMTHKHITDFRRAWDHAGLDPRQNIGELDTPRR